MVTGRVVVVVGAAVVVVVVGGAVVVVVAMVVDGVREAVDAGSVVDVVVGAALVVVAAPSWSWRRGGRRRDVGRGGGSRVLVGDRHTHPDRHAAGQDDRAPGQSPDAPPCPGPGGGRGCSASGVPGHSGNLTGEPEQPMNTGVMPPETGTS